jgi:hypothetical protein
MVQLQLTVSLGYLSNFGHKLQDFVSNMKCVYCAVRPGSLTMVRLILVFKGLNPRLNCVKICLRIFCRF